MDASLYLDFVDRWQGLRADELQQLADSVNVKAIILPVNEETNAYEFGEYILGELKKGVSIVLLLKLHATNTRREPGGHYVALVPRENNRELEFFDPAGRPPKTYVLPAWMRAVAAQFYKTVYQRNRTQLPHSTSCGPWCIIRVMMSHLCRQRFIRDVTAQRYK